MEDLSNFILLLEILHQRKFCGFINPKVKLVRLIVKKSDHKRFYTGYERYY